jgi:uncharacterized membrane protein YbhN (UPF0104 family)
MACLAVVLSPIPLQAWVAWSVWGIAASALLGLASLPVLVRLRLLLEVRQRQLQSMVQALRDPRAFVEATAWSVLVQAGNVVLVWLIGLALDLDVPLSYYFVFVPMVSLLTLVPLFVAGIGVREEGVALFLAPLGVAQALAITLSLLWFAVFAAVGLIGGVVYLCGAYPKPVPAQPDAPEVPDDNGSLGRYPDQGRTGQFDQAA